MKKIAILGSTGSIGRQALQVVDNHARKIMPEVLAAGRNKEMLLAQVIKYRPKLVSIGEEKDAIWLRQHINDKGIEVLHGTRGVLAAATYPGVDTVLTAISGAAGLEPTVAAIKSGKNIALANKETLVAAGELVTVLARRHNVGIFPVDSEHSAIWQCLNGEDRTDIFRIILTASGGPFRKLSRNQMDVITPEAALKHPNWNMGPKITVDSATLMNKGLEVIEARWLFDIEYDSIKVVVHPESIVHSMVEFMDGSAMAQMAAPDMRVAIQYALLYPKRPVSGVPGLNWPGVSLTFEQPDLKRFPSLVLAYNAGKVGGTMPAAMNAANEVAVEAFLKRRIGFMHISGIVEKVMHKHNSRPYESLEEILEVDRWSRSLAGEFVENYRCN